MSKILSIDHGTRTGYCFIKDGEVIVNSNFYLKEKDNGCKLVEFEKYVEGLIVKYNPDIIGGETPHDLTNAKTTRILTAMYMIVWKLAAKYNKQFVEVNIRAMRKQICDNGWADKSDVAYKLSKVWNIPLNKLKVPIYYKVATQHHNKGDIKDFAYDESDSLALATYCMIENKELDLIHYKE